MSYEEHVRRQAEINLRNNPNATHLQSYQSDYQTVQTYNNEHDRLRREQEERNRQR